MRSGIIILIVMLMSNCDQTERSKITIAVAANMQFAIEEIAKEFTKKTKIDCDLVISSSGKLTAQIKEGAPYDIFVAANIKYPQEVYKSKLSTRPPKIYAYGQLVLWSLYNDLPVTITSLTDTYRKHIAIANPTTAPYGEAALQVLKQYKVYDSIKHKLVYGESISQTNQFIVSKAADIGFTAQSIVQSPKMKNIGTWQLIDRSMYTPISQGVVLVTQSTEVTRGAQQFYDFLFSSEAREILEDFGYLVSE